MPAKVLVVEDEEKIANFIARGLGEEGYTVEIAHSGTLALEKLEKFVPDIVILDLMLPDMDGIKVALEIRARMKLLPLLMLTARARTEDKVAGLDAGADDYLTKPFEFEELLARIRALLRRREGGRPTVLRIADLELDLVSRKVKRAGREISLTNKEFALLEYLVEHAGEVVTRAMISEHVWDQNFDSFTNVIDVYVNYLRNKIDRGHKPLIHTVRGVGYMVRE